MSNFTKNFKKINEVEIANIISDINRLDEEMFKWSIDGRSVSKKEFERIIRRIYNVIII